jgi:hypothetical protein
MSTAGYRAAFRDLYLSHFGPLLYLDVEHEKPTITMAPEEDEEDDSADEEDEEMEREIQEAIAGLTALKSGGPYLDDTDPPWDIHTTQFPEPEDDREDDDELLRFVCWHLIFGPMKTMDPRTVSASYGGLERTGHEVFVSSSIPWPGIGTLLRDILTTGAPLSAGMLVHAELWDTPFTAVLLAPVDAGSLRAGEIGGRERFALKAIPLTAAETALGRRSVGKLVAALDRAGALEDMDILRDCAVSPEATRRYWATQRVEQLAYYASKFQRRLGMLRGLEAAGAPEFIRENQRRLAHEAKLILRHLEPRYVARGPRVLH